MSEGTVSKLEARSHDNPDETRKPDMATVEVNNLGDFTIGRFTFQPGWSWSSSIKPVAKTEHCEKTHVGYCVSGQRGDVDDRWHPDHNPAWRVIHNPAGARRPCRG